MARLSEYGPGDPITWGPRTNHPLDPRNDFDRADELLADAANEIATGWEQMDRKGLRGIMGEAITEWIDDLKPDQLAELAELFYDPSKVEQFGARLWSGAHDYINSLAQRSAELTDDKPQVFRMRGAL